ncbi:MAG TPA: low-complexity tail membrane protein [Oscillatoriaceae cyanobacterium M7585_C2015_266]|nr:low-complexity tail membrane protein [Oscillatoriaceae cyanobacterium M7585_C2015_266]
MQSFWFDPYLWIHLAGLAALPLSLVLCMVGLALGEPLLPVWLEYLLVAGMGSAPVVGMQLFRPFYIFSILAVAVKPEELTTNQRQILSLFKKLQSRWLASASALVLSVVLWPIYRWAPLASPLASSLPQWRLLGLFVAALAFLFSNLFLQIPLSVLRLMLSSSAQFAAAEPMAPEQIRQQFSILGWQVKKILPPLATSEPTLSKSETLPSPVSEPK